MNGRSIDEPLLVAIDGDSDGFLNSSKNTTNGVNLVDAEYYYLSNRLGSISAILDADNQDRILEYYRYEVFGSATVLPIVDTSPVDGLEDTPLDLNDNNTAGPALVSSFGNTYLYTARRFDEIIGLYYYRNRYYDPRSGRAITRIPVGSNMYSTGNPQELEELEKELQSLYPWVDSDWVSKARNIFLSDGAKKSCVEKCTAFRLRGSYAVDTPEQAKSNCEFWCEKAIYIALGFGDVFEKKHKEKVAKKIAAYEEAIANKAAAADREKRGLRTKFDFTAFFIGVLQTGQSGFFPAPVVKPPLDIFLPEIPGTGHKDCLQHLEKTYGLGSKEEDVCDTYPFGYTYQGTDARCFCKCAGNSVWSMFVRACLKCEDEHDTEPDAAHRFCYHAATRLGLAVPFDTLAGCYSRCKLE